MFDYYRPAQMVTCPVTQKIVDEFQGKEGPCALFVWQEGFRHPVDQLASEDARISEEARSRFTLPDAFEFYGFPADEVCVVVRGRCENGIWIETKIARVLRMTQHGWKEEPKSASRE